MRSIRIVCAAAALSAAALAQVPIKSLPFVIEVPGSYRLFRSLASPGDGIIVNASHVTLDLKGFALTGLQESTDGILVRGQQTDVSIVNGTISGWGGHGIRAGDALNVHLADLRVTGNGAAGAALGHAAIVEDVLFQANGGTGLSALGQLVASGLTSTGNAGYGILAGPGSLITGNSIAWNFGGGLHLQGPGRIAGNTVLDNGKTPGAGGAECGSALLAGISVLGPGAMIEGNVLFSNAIGLRLEDAGSMVRDNLVRRNQQDYLLAQGNLLELVIADVPVRIEWPALLTLAGTLTASGDDHGLVIASDDVTLDLRGHALQASAEATGACGVLVEGPRHGLVVRNGIVRGWPACGINATEAVGAHFEDLLLEGNGVQGLSAGDSSVIRDVVAHANLVDGVRTGTDCMVLSCSFTANGNDGLQLGNHGQVVDCVASENTLFGIKAQLGTSVRSATASRNSMGISVLDGSSVTACTASGNGLIGIRAERASVVSGNSCDGNGTNIAVVGGPGTKVTHNNVSAGEVGLLLGAPGNLAYCNTASGNVVNYDATPGNALAVVQDVAGNPAFWVPDAWANLSF